MYLSKPKAMKVRTKIIKGWVNIFPENNSSNLFAKNLKEYQDKHLIGYNKLQFWETLRGKNATEKVVIKGWYWRGKWSDPTTEVVKIFYK